MSGVRPPLAAPAEVVAPPEAARQAAHRGLDWLNLYVANIQTGFGPFIAVYLTTRGWTQTGIGVALSIGTVTAMASQVPAGALVDVLRNKAVVAAFSVAAFTISALMLALWPIQLFVYLAEMLHGFSSCTLGPAIAAISLGLAGNAALGVRLGRNARFASIGNGIGAALMGACGSFVSERAVFFLTAALTAPAFFALRPLRRFAALQPAAPAQPAGMPAQTTATPAPAVAPATRGSWKVILDRRLILFSVCAMLFTFANAPLLPLAAADLTGRVGHLASLLIGVCIVLPQCLVALGSPLVGRLADSHGRKWILLLGCTMLPLRGVLFAYISNPYLVVATQLLDGVAAACFGIMVPLITSDVAGRSGHYNLALGAVGFAIGIGATLSTVAAGWVADHFSHATAFLDLAAVGFTACLVAAGLVPETRPGGPPSSVAPLPVAVPGH